MPANDPLAFIRAEIDKSTNQIKAPGVLGTIVSLSHWFIQPNNLYQERLTPAPNPDTQPAWQQGVVNSNARVPFFTLGESCYTDGGKRPVMGLLMPGAGVGAPWYVIFTSSYVELMDVQLVELAQIVSFLNQEYPR